MWSNQTKLVCVSIVESPWSKFSELKCTQNKLHQYAKYRTFNFFDWHCTFDPFGVLHDVVMFFFADGGVDPW